MVGRDVQNSYIWYTDKETGRCQVSTHSSTLTVQGAAHLRPTHHHNCSILVSHWSHCPLPGYGRVVRKLLNAPSTVEKLSHSAPEQVSGTGAAKSPLDTSLYLRYSCSLLHSGFRFTQFLTPLNVPLCSRQFSARSAPFSTPLTCSALHYKNPWYNDTRQGCRGWTDLERKGEIKVCVQQTTLWKNYLIWTQNTLRTLTNIHIGYPVTQQQNTKRVQVWINSLGQHHMLIIFCIFFKCWVQNSNYHWP